MGIKITRSKFREGEPFYQSFAALANQTWGGKADSELMTLAVVLQNGVRDFGNQRDKYIKEFGKPNDDGLFSMIGAAPEDLLEYDRLMAEMFEVEIELPIDEPIKLVKRKKTIVTPFQAAAITEIIQIEWPNDNGEDLDKVEKK